MPDLLSRADSTLLLSDQSIFSGISNGAEGTFYGEVVFNTAMGGYQEVMTDPSYAGQIVCFTHVHIGNTGLNLPDQESDKVHVSGVLVSNLSETSSNYRSTEDSLAQYCKRHNIPLLSRVDTRRLTHILRDKGCLGACIQTGVQPEAFQASQDIQDKILAASHLAGKQLAYQVSTAQTQIFEQAPWSLADSQPKDEPASVNVTLSPTVVVLDLGVKSNICRLLVGAGAKVIVMPALSSLEDILAHQPNGILLSNGPGDPTDYPQVIKLTEQIIDYSLQHQLPVLAICLGCQILGLASGGSTEKMKFGHHGVNHPIQSLVDQKVTITSQNHNYCLSESPLPTNFQMTHRSLFDQSIQAIAHTSAPITAYQGHPEASPGPLDATSFFSQFVVQCQANK